MSDTAVVGGKIHTVDSSKTIAEAMLVRNGIITAVGTSDRIRSGAGPHTRVVDLVGGVVVPGLIDPHNHLTLAAFEPMSVDCYTPPLQSIDEVLQRIAVHCRDAVPGQ